MVNAHFNVNVRIILLNNGKSDVCTERTILLRDLKFCWIRNK